MSEGGRGDQVSGKQLQPGGFQPFRPTPLNNNPNPGKEIMMMIMMMMTMMMVMMMMVMIDIL